MISLKSSLFHQLTFFIYSSRASLWRSAQFNTSRWCSPKRSELCRVLPTCPCPCPCPRYCLRQSVTLSVMKKSTIAHVLRDVSQLPSRFFTTSRSICSKDDEKKREPATPREAWELAMSQYFLLFPDFVTVVPNGLMLFYFWSVFNVASGPRGGEIVCLWRSNLGDQS